MISLDQGRSYADFLSILRRSTDLLNESPVREEIFSVERLEQYAFHLAEELKLSEVLKHGRSLLPELKKSGRDLLAAYATLAQTIQNRQAVSPAAEWFVDNFHIVEEQLREIRQDLPANYYYELPKLAEGELNGYPRVYALALAIIAHTDSRLDLETLQRFIRAFQQRSPLKIGELWAVPITLRIALVEHLKPLALRIVSARAKRQKADLFADRLLLLASQPKTNPEDLVHMLATELSAPEQFDRAYIVQLIQRLREQDPNVWPAFDWLEHQLNVHYETNTHQVTQLDHHQQAAAQVTVGNIISSMRLLSSLDWRDFFEKVSLVDPVLNADPAEAYSKMDFATRDRYRHVVERLSKRSGVNEIDVAQKLVDTARAAFTLNPKNERTAHVGHYLIGKGRRNFEISLAYRPGLSERFSRTVLNHPTFFYLGSLTILSGILLTPVIRYFSASEGALGALVLFSLLALIPSSEFALNILNHLVTYLIKPQPLPKLDMEGGLPEGATTMVVIPALLSSEEIIRELLENLQVCHLANNDAHIYFGLLGDFSDDTTESSPHDQSRLAYAREGIAKLNLLYGSEEEGRFHLFVRKRQWNPSEQLWMGYERKRGKLHEFNRLLRGATDTSYTVCCTAEPSFLSKVQYVITLDSDTQLPRGSAHRLIGTALHPLNRPVLDPKLGRVVEGYGILQPRISISLLSATRTRFAQIFSGNTGLDPYTTAVSDVYQDLFGEGSFTGKGLYVVDAFEESLKGRVPENWLLSHDLFEGSFARSALVTDVEFYDDYPSNFEAYSKRQHRWIRGDWQIADWLFPKVPTASGKYTKNQLSLISRWKIFDNLRRSLVPPSVLLWLALAWTVLPGSPFWWTALIFGLLVFPIYTSVTNSILLHRRGISWRSRFRNDWAETRMKLSQIFLTIAFLLQQAWTHTDAIARTLYRKFFSHKRLLEWVTFAQVEQHQEQKDSIWNSMGPAPGISLGLFVAVLLLRLEALPVAAPILLVWMASPLINRWVKQKSRSREIPLGPLEIEAFRLYARRTWHFFETFVTAEGNWLAPDNFQEDPSPVVAHRTSPTNIGLQLLSTASAYDFGYLGAHQFLDSLEKTFETLAKLPKMQGHFFNWYDTKTLEPLKPQYISTVDSGNLAGHLLTLKHCCLELVDRPLVHPEARTGLRDTLHLLHKDAIRVEGVVPSSGAVTLETFQETIESIIDLVQTTKWKTVAEWGSFLELAADRLNEAEDMLNALGSEAAQNQLAETRGWLTALVRQVAWLRQDLDRWIPATKRSALPANVTLSQLHLSKAEEITNRCEALAAKCEEIALGMNFRFLFDDQRKIFIIGYNVTDGRRDNSYYDLLASESRLASFLSIAKGEIPQEHWFRLGRQMTPVKGGRALISWTGTMFEYLMPLLCMERYPETLLDQTYQSVVRRQIQYGEQRGVPWGVSEAGYNARDLQLIYQYGPFGIPGLGLKRGLSDDLVVSPYSTMLACLIDPWAALANLQRLASIGALARYGFYESIDYTPDRLPKKQKSFILRSFMAHHQGMSLVSINNLLHRQVMPRRFHSDPLIQATQLLLQERIPHDVPLTRPRAEEVRSAGSLRFNVVPNPRLYLDVNLPTPRTQLLSNGTYSVMMTSAGSGYSRCGPIAVSRWREDVTCDNWGQFFYIRNRHSGRIWSVGSQPSPANPREYAVTFAEDKVEFWRKDGKVTTHTEIIVSPEDNVELRRISLTNTGESQREIEVTSFLETVLARPEDDAAHPAFSNLFIQTEFIPSENALLATRRTRSPSETPIWAFHVLIMEGESVGTVQYDTDRARFIGRGRNTSKPFVIAEDRPLSNSVGAVLDPIFSLRQSVKIPPGETVRVTFATGISTSRGDALRLADKYHDIHIFAREAELAWTKSQVQLRHLNISTDKAHIFQRLAGRVLYSDPSLRPRSHVLALNTKAQSSLWAYGISGDIPIVLVRIRDEKDMGMVRELLHAHEYFRFKGLIIDLVIVNEQSASYIQALQDELQRQIRITGSHNLIDKNGGIFIRRADLIPQEDLLLLQTVARVSLNAGKGSLDEQLKRRPVERELPDPFVPTTAPSEHPDERYTLPELSFFNGLGGFSQDGKNYVTILKEGQWTPAPWLNVISNRVDFGFIISESGGGYSWSGNSRENRLTPWSNDAVSDPVGEAIYIRDEETGEYWTPTPLPIREKETYVIKHGQGYSQFEHTSHGIVQAMSVFVPLDASVKICILRLENLGEETRRLSVTSFTEWVLGFRRGPASPYVITELDELTGAIFARNPYNNEFATRVAFADICEPNRTLTCNRKEFLGRNGSTSAPAAMGKAELSGDYGGGLDPCAAFQTKFELEGGETREIVCLLGEAEDADKARALVEQFRKKEEVTSAFDEVTHYWDDLLDVIRVTTPDAAMNMIMNRWLPYQTLSCRLWGRSAFYQSGGAFGFRDQLQDVMALTYARPEIARQQIIRAAGRQFKEGDVQHWWHPPTGRGVRTHCSDDLIWLPYVTNFYIGVTGDISILDETIGFLEAPELLPGQEDSYTQPAISNEAGSLFEHCARALDRSLKVGVHGLPLMGSCDWNDGMNRVGNGGKGESVWVGWFLYATLREFIPYCEKRGDGTRANNYRHHLGTLQKSLEDNAWDGDWYRRAYFDDGTPLGSASNQECRIDSIAQSWAVLSGAANPQRAMRAMASVDEFLVHRGDGLVKLFTPPFDRSALDPGYIKGYVPGVRENGGQYTHAAIWTLMAFAALGDGDKAGELYALLNPINHASSRAGLHKYKVEPYVAAADVYGLWPHVGRGGWTWYTGSASWMYRAGLESILGFELKGDVLRMNPHIPKWWKDFEIKFQRGKALYVITVINRENHATPAPKIELDGKPLPTTDIPVPDDQKSHTILIHL